MVGVPQCWNCGFIDPFSSARRIYCEKCNANVWYKTKGLSFPSDMKFRPGSKQ